MEGTHRQLRAWFANRLSSYDTHGIADLDQPAGTHVPAIAHLTDAVTRFAGQRRAQVQLRHLPRGRDRIADGLVDDRVALDNHFTGGFVYDVSCKHPAWQLGQTQL